MLDVFYYHISSVFIATVKAVNSTCIPIKDDTVAEN